MNMIIFAYNNNTNKDSESKLILQYACHSLSKVQDFKSKDVPIICSMISITTETHFVKGST